MAKQVWTERTFHFDFPAARFPDVLERVRGTPARIEERVRGISRELLTRRFDQGWSIQENVGHLLDLGYLPMTRIDEILSGASVLCAADMSNLKTHEANHNDADIDDLLAAFRTERARLIARLEGLEEMDLDRFALHPRLQQPMRIVDIAYFDAEHDDYHLARISELMRMSV